MTITSRDEDLFIAYVKEGGATAVPAEGRGATAWVGDVIRSIRYERRERIGNALLANGRLRLGEPVIGSNAVQIEVVE